MSVIREMELTLNVFFLKELTELCVQYLGTEPFWVTEICRGCMVDDVKLVEKCMKQVPRSQEWNFVESCFRISWMYRSKQTYELFKPNFTQQNVLQIVTRTSPLQKESSWYSDLMKTPEWNMLSLYELFQTFKMEPFILRNRLEERRSQIKGEETMNYSEFFNQNMSLKEQEICSLINMKEFCKLKYMDTDSRYIASSPLPFFQFAILCELFDATIEQYVNWDFEMSMTRCEGICLGSTGQCGCVFDEFNETKKQCVYGC